MLTCTNIRTNFKSYFFSLHQSPLPAYLMGKKLKFPFLFKATETAAASASATSSSWPWPTCVNNPKTVSFRANNETFKTMNSAYLDKTTSDQEIDDTPDSVFSINNSFDEIFSCESGNDELNIETVVRDLRSDRFFFEPGETSSILEEAKTDEYFPYKESTLMAIESGDPSVDFRISMEEMVAAYGLKKWECLEELLTCYLRVNSQKNHGYIVGAFVDLLVHLEFVALNSSSSWTDHEHCSSSSCSSSAVAATQYSFTSPFSFSSSTSPCLSSLENEDKITEKNVDTASSESVIVQHASSSNTVLSLDV